MTNPPTPRAMGALPYARMNGIGNAILVVDGRGHPALDGEAAREIAWRPGFSFDQLMVVEVAKDPGSEAFVTIFNADGSRAGACGNGMRCVAWYLTEASGESATVVETAGGLLACRRDDEWRFTVDMGAPHFDWRRIPLGEPVSDTRAVVLDAVPTEIAALGPVSVVGMGNPHAVFWLGAGTATPDVAALGPVVECHPLFPDRVNVSFARVEAPDRIRLDVWERGAGRTLACGSAACATLVAAVRGERASRRAAVTQAGGTLVIEWREADGHVLMGGPVELERRGWLERPMASAGRRA